MKLKISLFLLLSLAVFSFACAKSPSGSYEITWDTIAEGLRTGKLMVNEPGGSGSGKGWPGSNAKVAIPELPPNQIRIAGMITESNKYQCGGSEAHAAMRGMEMYGECSFGALCSDGGWFYADIDESSGEIVRAYAYFYGDWLSGTVAAGIFDQKHNGSYGYVKNGKFALGISGTISHCDVGHLGGREDEGIFVPDFPDWDKLNTSIVIRGNGNILKAANGATFPVNLYVGLKSLDQKIGRIIDCDINLMAKGLARVQRGK